MKILARQSRSLALKYEPEMVKSSRPGTQGTATRSGRGQGWSDLADCCSGVGLNSIRLNSCIKPGEIKSNGGQS